MRMHRPRLRSRAAPAPARPVVGAARQRGAAARPVEPRAARPPRPPLPAWPRHSAAPPRSAEREREQAGWREGEAAPAAPRRRRAARVLAAARLRRAVERDEPASLSAKARGTGGGALRRPSRPPTPAAPTRRRPTTTGAAPSGGGGGDRRGAQHVEVVAVDADCSRLTSRPTSRRASVRTYPARRSLNLGELLPAVLRPSASHLKVVGDQRRLGRAAPPFLVALNQDELRLLPRCLGLRAAAGSAGWTRLAHRDLHQHPSSA